MRIFIGLEEVANNIYEFSEALKKDGHMVKTVAFAKKYYMKNKYDEILQRPLSPLWIEKTKIWFISYLYFRFVTICLLIRNIKKFEVFVFVWTTTFMPFMLDLILLKLFRKKVIVFNCGDDVRYRPIQTKIDEIKGAKFYFYNPEYAKKANSFKSSFAAQKMEELSGCIVVSTREQATFQKKPVYISRFPTSKKMEQPKDAKQKPLIVHAPSDRVVKGTKYVLEAIALLERESLVFDFELIENQSNEYVQSRLRDADIVIDQPGTWIAKFASEALAYGCVVVGGNDPEYLGYHDVDKSPVLQFYPDGENLSELLKNLIIDQKNRNELMHQSYYYWRKYYSPEMFCEYFNHLLTEKAEMAHTWLDKKKLLMRFSENIFQKIVIKLFY